MEEEAGLPVAAPIPPDAPVMRTFLLNRRWVGKMPLMVI